MRLSLPCSCDRAGYCERMRLDMRERPRLFELCQTREDYRTFWEASAHGLSVPSNEHARACRHFSPSPAANSTDCLQLFVHRCDVHGWCRVNASENQTERSCVECRQYEPRYQPTVEPIRVVRIDSNALAGPEPKLNAGMIEHHGRLLLGYRTGWGDANIGIAELDPETFSPRWSKVVMGDRAAHGHVGWEDPRLFLFRGQLHCGFTGWGGRLSRVAQIMVGRLDDAFEFEKVWRPDYAENQTLEKNWGFFEFEDDLLTVYSIAPHRVLRLHDEMATVCAETDTPLPWDFGVPRGGASPVRWGEEFYNFFHAVRWRPTGGRCYSMGCYTFAAEHPFRILRMTPEPLLVPNDQQMSTHQYAVVFPCGAVRRGDHWEISYGHQDCEVRVATFASDDIESALVPV